jgi:hypothetical protein
VSESEFVWVAFLACFVGLPLLIWFARHPRTTQHRAAASCASGQSSFVRLGRVER